MQSSLAETEATFLRLIKDPSVRTVLLTGTGGGFDFSHSMHFYPMLAAAGKKVIVHSYSFGEPRNIRNSVPFTASDAAAKTKSQPFPQTIPANFRGWPEVRIVNAKCTAWSQYGPEVAWVSFLEQKFKKHPKELAATIATPPLPLEQLQEQPQQAAKQQQNDVNGTPIRSTNNDDDAAATSTSQEHAGFWLYASNARAWTAAALQNFYGHLVLIHDIDAIICVDGGSDSLMRGDERSERDPEHGVPGDQIEDACTVASVASLPEEVIEGKPFAPIRLLCGLGFGNDRWMGCSDFDSLKAIGELTALSRPPISAAEKAVVVGADNAAIHGFLGVHTVEPGSNMASWYRELIEHNQEHFNFRSVIANSICATTRGAYGMTVPPELRGRVRPGELYLWPLMSWILSFDIRLVVQRSLLASRLLKCPDVPTMYACLKSVVQEARAEEQRLSEENPK